MRLLPAIALALSWPAAVFAAEVSPLALLSDAEQSYYEQVFSYTMDVIQPGGHYDWASYGGKGSISVDKPFVSKSGYTCRRFSESFTVQNRPGKDEGVGCKRIGREGWCKLRPDNALTCAMETPYYHLNIPSVGTGASLPNVNMDAPDMPGGSNVNMGGSGYDPGTHEKPTATGYANTVTGTAGNAASTVAGHAKEWFNDIFR